MKEQVKKLVQTVVMYVFTKYVVPALKQELNEFAQDVVKSKLNAVNGVDVNDVVNIARNRLIYRITSDKF